MKTLLTLILLGSSSLVYSQKILKEEAILQLKATIDQTENIPESLTAKILFNKISGEVDFSLTAKEQQQLEQGKPIRDEKDFKEVLSQAKSLKKLNSRLSDLALLSVLKDADATERHRETAFRLLRTFNQQKIMLLSMNNTSRAKRILLELIANKKITKLDDLRNYDQLRYKTINGKEAEWKFSTIGFGELSKATGYNGNVIIMAPHSIEGKLIVGCDNGAVYRLPNEKLKETIDISHINMKEEKKKGAK